MRGAAAGVTAVAVMLGALAGAVAPVAAHAEYESSDPAAGAVLTAAPAAVTVVFSEEIVQDGSSLAVFGSDGGQVDNGDATLDLNDLDRRTLTVTLRPGLGDGVYRVEHTALAVDGHASDPASFTFEVSATGMSRAQASPAASPIASPAASPGASPAVSPGASPEASPGAGTAGSTAESGDGLGLGAVVGLAVVGASIVGGLGLAGVRWRRLASRRAG